MEGIDWLLNLVLPGSRDNVDRLHRPDGKAETVPIVFDVDLASLDQVKPWLVLLAFRQLGHIEESLYFVVLRSRLFVFVRLRHGVRVV